ncbi:MAG: N-acetylmuramoyl-L-alanine amidase [Clostridia bacterium]|nr:N-acetylmuramoyl-L-alanine amidase [Clostridia bacterium]MBR5768829.1 N-acetylmuramoyl-L-alanine amidase [Clostridia bacterium]
MSIIVIDCGHNAAGRDRGARCHDGRMENDLNQAVSARLAALLKAAGHNVVSIGNDGSGVVERGACGANNNCDLLLSIHHNAYGGGANGTSVIKSVFADRDAPKAAQCGKLILEYVSDAIGTRARNGGAPATKWNGARTADYYGVIRGNRKHNTLIVECLFCDNPSDLSRWDPDRIAAAICGAVCAVFGKPSNVVETKPEAPAPFAVGELVEFSGGAHYVSSDAKKATGGVRTPGRARLTKIVPGRAHPYHLIGTTSNVWGWVDADRVSKGESR